MYAAINLGQTSSITSHNINKPAISKSGLAIFPVWNNSLISSGQASQNTVGVHSLSLPVMIPQLYD